MEQRKKRIMDVLIYFHMVNQKQEFLLDNFKPDEIAEMQAMIEEFHKKHSRREMEEYAQAQFKSHLKRLHRLRNEESPPLYIPPSANAAN